MSKMAERQMSHQQNLTATQSRAAKSDLFNKGCSFQMWGEQGIYTHTFLHINHWGSSMGGFLPHPFFKKQIHYQLLRNLYDPQIQAKNHDFTKLPL